MTPARHGCSCWRSAWFGNDVDPQGFHAGMAPRVLHLDAPGPRAYTHSMATRLAPTDEDVSSLRASGLSMVERARTVFQIGARVSLRVGMSLALVFVMLFGPAAGEPAGGTEAVAAARGQDDHASGRHFGPSGSRELVAEAESRDELEERADAPPVAVVRGAAGVLAAAGACARAVGHRRAGSRLGRSVGLGRGPPVRV